MAGGALPACCAVALLQGETAPAWSTVQVLTLAFAITGQLLSVVFVYRLLVRGGSPASTLLWMGLILITPWLGLLLYYMLPRQLQLRRLRRVQVRGVALRRRRQRQSEGLPADTTPSEPCGDVPAAAALRAGGSGLKSLLATETIGLDAGNEVVWLPAGEDFYRAAAEAIGLATRSVHCVVYILRPDSAGLRFLALLAAAARRGVAVRLLYDSFGSFGLQPRHLTELHAAGGQAEFFLPLLWKRRPFTVNLRNHRKLLVVDDEVGFLGGRNVGDEYFSDRLGRARQWLDGMVQVRGPVVQRLAEVFAEDWCTATEIELPPSVPPSAVGGQATAIVCSGPDRASSSLWNAVIQALAEAQRSILLSSPYLVPPPMLEFVLQLAAARGVLVRIHTNGPRTEAALLYHAQRSRYARLLEAGIEIHETVDCYNHAKVLVIDEQVVCIGSANMDLRSANLNFEIAAVVVDAPQLAASILATLESRQATFRRITAADLPRQHFWRAVDGFCALWSPLL